jgi:hypothetical protein
VGGGGGGGGGGFQFVSDLWHVGSFLRLRFVSDIGQYLQWSIHVDKETRYIQYGRFLLFQ